MNRYIKKYLSNQEFYHIVEDLLQHTKVQEMKSHRHHGVVTCYDHSIHVSYLSWKISKCLGFNHRTTANGALLHDLFLYDWKIYKPTEGKHGFVHPRRAYKNAKIVKQLDSIEKDIIIKHMWPLTPSIPTYKETWVVVMVDKYCALTEFFWR